MAEFTAKDIQKLRVDAGVGMMDAKQALTDADGDFDKAFELLRERGQAKMAKRAERDANEGTIGSYIHLQNGRPVMGVLVELACETDFVAKSDEFREVADDIAMHVSWGNPGWITREAVDEAEVEKEREILARQAVADGKPENVVERIVEGKINSWYSDNVLYEQKFVNAEKFDGTVGDLVGQLAAKMGENISVRKVARVAIGE
jgi:elongation factor Ts